MQASVLPQRSSRGCQVRSDIDDAEYLNSMRLKFHLLSFTHFTLSQPALPTAQYPTITAAMPPKKAQAAKAVAKKDKAIASHSKPRTAQKDAEAENNDMPDEKSHAPETNDNGDVDSKKRKSPPNTNTKTSKVPRQGSRSSARNARSTSSTSDPTPKQVLNYLLSASALPHCYPSDELDAAHSDSKLKTYSLTSPSNFTPFEHLLSSHMLSKPLSHTLGMRSIRTLLNSPFNLNTPQAIVDAGQDRVYEALESAKTQHRQKTAEYVYNMAKEYVDDEKMYELAVAANEEGPQGVVRHIDGSVKGMGKMGAELFARRVQACEGWGEAVWPFADEKSLSCLKECGVDVETGDDLQRMLEREIDWSVVGRMGLNERKVSVGEEGDEVQVAVEFVVACERAVGCVLEGNVKALREAAAEV